MDNTREKLIELITGFYGVDPMYYGVETQPLVDHLIANGVTLDSSSKWISVKDRLPEKEDWYLVFTTPNRGYKSINKGYFCKGYDWDKFTPRWHGSGGNWANVTHWMPLPQPPKGE